MSIELITRLQERRLNAWEQAKSILENAETEGRGLDAAEEEAWQRANTDLDALDERITALVDAEQRAADAAAAFAAIDARPADRGAPASAADRIRAFLRGESGRAITVMPTDAEVRDLTKGTATAGGNTVPTSFYGRLWAHLIEVANVINAGATVLTTTSGENFEVPTTTAHSTGALTTEGNAISESDPAFAKRTLGAYKYAVLLQASSELLQDTGVDIEGYIAMQAGRAVGNALGAHLATGTGSSQPSGIVTGASSGVTGGTGVSGAFTADNLIDLHFSVIAPYRNSPACGWLMKDSSMASVRKLKDGANQYLWSPSTAPGAIDTILGKPVYTDPNIAATAINAKSVLFGDFSAYFVRVVNGVRFERSDEYAFNADLATFRAVIRADGILVDQTGAVKYFAGGAS